MNKPTSDWLVLIRSLVAGFDSTRDSAIGNTAHRRIATIFGPPMLDAGCNPEFQHHPVGAVLANVECQRNSTMPIGRVFSERVHNQIYGAQIN